MKTVYCPYCGGRAFRSRTAEFREVWPMPECVDAVHRVVFVDGIYLARDIVVLIARLRRCGRKPWSSAAFGMLSPWCTGTRLAGRG